MTKDQKLSLYYFYNLFSIEEGLDPWTYYMVFEDEENFNLGD
jgi:hypothetical protein